MFLVESLRSWNEQEGVYNKHVDKRTQKQWIVLKSYLFIPNSKITRIRTRNISIRDKKDSSIKYENMVWTGFEHGRLKQKAAGDLTNYPTPLLN